MSWVFEVVQDEGDMDHGAVVDGQLLVARGDAPPLLEPTDQPLHDIAAPVGPAVVAAPASLGPMLILAVGDDRLYAAHPQKAPDPPGAIAAVARQPHRPAHQQHTGGQEQV